MTIQPPNRRLDDKTAAGERLVAHDLPRLRQLSDICRRIADLRRGRLLAGLLYRAMHDLHHLNSHDGPTPRDLFHPPVWAAARPSSR